MSAKEKNYSTEITNMLRGYESIEHRLNTIKDHMEHFDKDPEGYKKVVNYTVELARSQYLKSLPLIKALRSAERGDKLVYKDGGLNLPVVTQRSEQLKGDYTEHFLTWKRDFWIYLEKYDDYKSRYGGDLYRSLHELEERYMELNKNKSPFNCG